MDEKETQLSLYRGLANKLITSGEKMMRTAFKLAPLTSTKFLMMKTLNDAGFVFPISLSDEVYKLIDFETWKKIIKYDWANEIPYESDIHDCDNFAFGFASRMAEIFKINSAGVAFGTIKNKDTGAVIGRHAYVCIVTASNAIYFFEPQTHLFTGYTKGQPVVIGNWKYESDWFIFF